MNIYLFNNIIITAYMFTHCTLSVVNIKAMSVFNSKFKSSFNLEFLRI